MSLSFFVQGYLHDRYRPSALARLRTPESIAIDVRPDPERWHMTSVLSVQLFAPEIAHGPSLPSKFLPALARRRGHDQPVVSPDVENRISTRVAGRDRDLISSRINLIDVETLARLEFIETDEDDRQPEKIVPLWPDGRNRRRRCFGGHAESRLTENERKKKTSEEPAHKSLLTNRGRPYTLVIQVCQGL